MLIVYCLFSLSPSQVPAKSKFYLPLPLLLSSLSLSLLDFRNAIHCDRCAGCYFSFSRFTSRGEKDKEERQKVNLSQLEVNKSKDTNSDLCNELNNGPVQGEAER